MIQAEKNLRRQFGIFAAQPPSAWTDKVVFPEGYEPAYAPTFRGVGIAQG
jgi:peptide/nickel transport system substrate-binding protein